ncbi:DUF4214 domain-containing protein [Desulfosoma caldarium]|uniref:Uncharacterized protein DUF4214 n=1 Tax=Desulfosoma caldarium TaxID=610254 RepID=A0A3N1VK19_9BACT|nr:DUF4214 domain-containing protein [Desulfosoma caldarium]ROR03156.1 uncharacterized protein DUF4214 [Desulfosoma caldarium]
MAELTTKQWIEAFFVAYFGRAGDREGVGYWLNLVETELLDLAGVAENFAPSEEAKAKYTYFNAVFDYEGYPITDAMYEQFVSQVYQNLFERLPDDGGKAYWVNQLKTGASSPGAFIAHLINAAYEGREGDSTRDWATIRNKALAAEYFTQYVVDNNIQWSDELSQQSIAVLDDVGSDSDLDVVFQQIEDAITQVGPPGEVYTLTTGVDTIEGTAGNDTIIADNTGTAKQLTAADQIDGGAGNDVLKIYAAGDDNLSQTEFGTLSNVENIYINNGVLFGTLDVSGLTGVTGIALDSPQEMKDGDTFTLKTASEQTVSLAKVTGEGTVELYDASDVTLNGVDIKLDLASKGTALKLTTTGEQSDIELANTGGNLASLTIVADTDLEIIESLPGLKNIDASSSTGDVTIDASGLPSDNHLTFKGGAGEDMVIFAEGHLTANDNLDGGPNEDLILVLDKVMNYAGINAAKNFEELGLGADTTVDIAQITNGIQKFGALGGLTVGFENALSTNKFFIVYLKDTSDGGTISISNKVGETATTVIISNESEGGKTLSELTLNGALNITLISEGESSSVTNTIQKFNNLDNSAITVEGNADLTFGLASATTTGSKVDASAFTGSLTVTGSGKGDVLMGGSGDDTLIIADNTKGISELTGNGGRDTFDVGGAINTGETVDVVITDAAAGDKIVLADKGSETWTKGAVDVSSAASLAAALDIACAGDGSTNAIIKWFKYADNTYIVEDMSADANFVAETDLVIKLTGLADLSDSTYEPDANQLTIV